MDFKARNDIPSCSSLGRIKNCGGSWALSKGVDDTTSKDADKGQDVHDCLKRIVLGELKNPQTEEEQTAWKLWGHMQNRAFELFGDAELVWKAEERIWLINENLEPVLSGQYDALCYPKEQTETCLVFDAKTGWLAGDVPFAASNPQMQGLAVMLVENGFTEVYGSIVREWAADAPDRMSIWDWVKEMAEDVNKGEYDVWHKAGLKTGEWCQFCPAKGNCPAYRDAFAMVIANDPSEFNISMEAISAPNLVRILRASPMAEKVIDAAKSEAHRRRLAGEELPGVLWEKGNTKRKIADEAKFGMKMLAAGIDLGAFQKTEIPIGSAYKAWVKHLKKKDNKETKDQFNRDFADCLEFTENQPSLSFE